MSDFAIKINNVSKQYRLGKFGTGSLSHDINRLWHTLRGKEDPYLKIGQTNDRTRKADSEYVWALKDINFEVKHGEVLGVIGRNGAGKSTLLKILSKITSPSTGEIKINGRIASLLEVGTGFHPELTGRENIFLNGAILGMRKKEIQKKFDEIVDFSGVEAYIDTPVKRYSSGMYVRLAFAVAAHLEPEILIVDEVLAVGDAEFQKKCLGKMKDVSVKQGRTVLFVSHNMAAIANLCNSALLLQNGSIQTNGKTSDVIDLYNNISKNNLNIPLFSRNDRQGIGDIKFYQIEVLNKKNDKILNLVSGSSMYINIIFHSFSNEIYKNSRVSISVNYNNNPLFLLSSDLVSDNQVTLKNNSSIEFNVDKLPLARGSYMLTLFLECNGVIQDWIEDAYEIFVEDGNYYGNGKNYPLGWGGKTVLIDHRFNSYETGNS